MEKSEYCFDCKNMLYCYGCNTAKNCFFCVDFEPNEKTIQPYEFYLLNKKYGQDTAVGADIFTTAMRIKDALKKKRARFTACSGEKSISSQRLHDLCKTSLIDAATKESANNRT